MKKRHRYHSPWKRAGHSALLVFIVMLIGTVGMQAIEHMPFLDSFYFMSMLATAQGPTIAPHTSAGKLFASLMAFLSVGSVVAALGFLFGPFFGQLWKIGVETVEEVEEEIKNAVTHKKDPHDHS